MVCDGWQECMALVPRMLRVWQAARCCDENPLPQMHARTAPFAVTPEFVPACDSLFALTEAVLRRRLIPARSCSAMLSRDEVAVMALLRCCPDAGTVQTSAVVPHGLPGALHWAAYAVRSALAETFDLADATPTAAIVPQRCPFELAA